MLPGVDGAVGVVEHGAPRGLVTIRILVTPPDTRVVDLVAVSEWEHARPAVGGQAARQLVLIS